MRDDRERCFVPYLWIGSRAESDLPSFITEHARAASDDDDPKRSITLIFAKGLTLIFTAIQNLRSVRGSASRTLPAPPRSHSSGFWCQPSRYRIAAMRPATKDPATIKVANQNSAATARAFQRGSSDIQKPPTIPPCRTELPRPILLGTCGARPRSSSEPRPSNRSPHIAGLKPSASSQK